MENWIFLGVFVIIIATIIIKSKSYEKIVYIIKRKNKKNSEQEKTYYNFNLVKRYFNNVIKYKSFYHVISDKTANDFDIDEVFKKIDYTNSKIGQQFFYAKLRTISQLDELYKFDDFVEQLGENDLITEKIIKALKKLGNDNAYYVEELIHGQQISKPIWFKLAQILSLSFLLLLISSIAYPPLLLGLIPIYITNMVLHYKNKTFVNYYLIAVSEFSKSIKTALNLSKYKIINDYFSNLDFLDRVKHIQSKSKFISFEKQVNNDLLAGIWGISELIKIAFNIEIILFYSFIDDIIKEQNSIDKLFRFIGEIDTAISVKTLRDKNQKWCKPEFEKTKKINVENIRHPLIVDCVPNSVLLTNKSLLLTGSNMSGKTTFIRTFSINALLAQTINTCFSDKFSAPFFKIYSSIRISDSIFSNKSYYLEEVLTIKEFIEASNQVHPCLFVLDEIFKGTNTLERISAGNAILKYLNNGKHIVFVSTHDIELTDLLKNNNYELYYFQEQIINEKLIFDHKLKNGSLQTKNAIKILELYNYPKEIIDIANNTVTYFKNNSNKNE